MPLNALTGRGTGGDASSAYGDWDDDTIEIDAASFGACSLYVRFTHTTGVRMARCYSVNMMERVGRVSGIQTYYAITL